ncbi:hypothetical protein H1R20_g1780, partial [Candolleomyces eurysporus]
MSPPPRKLAAESARQKVIPALGSRGPETPSSHRSKAAQHLLDTTKITMHAWDYPGPPASFLDYTWNCNWGDVQQFFGGLTREDPCPMKETPVLERIIVPVLMGAKHTFRNAFGVGTIEGNLMVTREAKTESKTAPDISLHQGKKNSEDLWEPDGESQSFMEGKGPLAAWDDALNEGLDAFLGKVIEEYLLSDEDYNEMALKILGQVLEACSRSQLKFGSLIAPPFLFRPICFIELPGQSEAHAFLAPNRINSDITDFRDQSVWEDFFCEAIWFAFCVWVKGLEDTQEAMEQHHMWDEWKDNVERTLCPDESRILGLQVPQQSRFLKSILRPINTIIRHSLSFSFGLFGPHLPFKFIKSFTTNQVQVSSQVNSSNWTSFLHASLPPDSIMYRDFAILCIYHRWGFVVKYAFEESGFGRELKALQGLTLMEHFPSLIAHGATVARPRASSIPFLVMTYHGEPLKEFDQSIVHLVYSTIIKPMHELGWHHHDIKPDNVLIDVHGKLTIIDFNLAMPVNECKQCLCPDLLFLKKWGINVIEH